MSIPVFRILYPSLHLTKFKLMNIMKMDIAFYLVIRKLWRINFYKTREDAFLPLSIELFMVSYSTNTFCWYIFRIYWYVLLTFSNFVFKDFSNMTKMNCWKYALMTKKFRILISTFLIFNVCTLVTCSN